MRRDPRRRYSLTSRFLQVPGQPQVAAFLMPRRILPKPGHVLHVVVAGDRLDRLAQHYYGDPRLWWAIAQANPDIAMPHGMIWMNAGPAQDRAALRVGQQIMIPAKPGEAE